MSYRPRSRCGSGPICWRCRRMFCLPGFNMPRRNIILHASSLLRFEASDRSPASRIEASVFRCFSSCGGELLHGVRERCGGLLRQVIGRRLESPMLASAEKWSRRCPPVRRGHHSVRRAARQGPCGESPMMEVTCQCGSRSQLDERSRSRHPWRDGLRMRGRGHGCGSATVTRDMRSICPASAQRARRMRSR